MSAHLQLKIDEELDAALRIRAEKEGRTVSSVVRDILRRGLSLVKSPREAGYMEGRTEAYGMVLRAVNEAIKKVPPAPRR